MLIFEPIGFLKSRPISLDMCYDCSIDFKERFHFHPGVEIIFIHKGVGRIIVEQHIYEINPGDLLFIKPFQPHYLQMKIGPGQPYVRSLIKYEPHYFAEYLKAFPNMYKFHNYLWKDPSILQVQKLPPSVQLERFLNESYERLKAYPLPDRMEGNALFLVSLFHYLKPLWENHDVSKHPSLTFSPVVVQIMNWIDENYHNEFQLEALSQTVHLTPNHVSTLFQKATGKTITEFLTIRRLKQACLLLKTTTRTVREIGEQSGWPNFAYFCHVFKKHLGITPKQYRHQ